MANKDRLRLGLLIFFFIFSLLGIPLGIYFYQFFYTKNIAVKWKQPLEVYITPDMDFNDLLKDIKHRNGVEDGLSFAFVAQFLDYQERIKPGYYRLGPDLSNLEAVRKLRAGQQHPVNVTFNNIRLSAEIAKKIAPQLMMSTESLDSAIHDPATQQSLGFDSLTIGCLFLPDTYQFYWTISPQAFLERMKDQYDRFWDETRLAKAEKLGLSPIEVAVLASIVDAETEQNDEKATIAGVYLNRLSRNMPLQADPTVVFAMQDFSLKRVLEKHLKVDSPFNTYKYTGLPPGPIRIPAKQTLDAVLNPESHRYLYFCAKADFSGYHAFAETLSEHNRNASAYQRALNRRGIR